MQAKGRFFSLLLVMNLFLTFSPGGAQDISEQDRVFISADRIEFDLRQQWIQGEGNIAVQFGELHVTSDEIDFSLGEGNLWARGNIHLSSDRRYRVESDSLHFNTQTRLWSIQNSRVFLSPFYFFTAEQAKQVSGERIIISKASYTACDPENPAWKISCSQGTVHLDHSATLKNISFLIKGKPVFLFPYLRFPIQREKAAGFLTPDFGRSSVSGIYIGNYFYWPLRDWTDLGLPIDYYEKRGIGAGLEYRYALTDMNRGYLRIYGISDHLKNKERGDASLQLQHFFSQQTRASIDAAALSDRDYHRDFQQEISKRYSNILESKAFLEKITDLWSGRIVADYAETLGEEQEAYYLKAPEIGFNTRLRSYTRFPLFLQWNSSWTQFHIHDPNNSLPGQDRGQRIDLSPKLYYSFNRHVLTLSPSFFYRKTFYRYEEQNETVDMSLYGGGMDVTGPRFHSTFKEQWQHVWYPQVSLLYETLDQQGKQIGGIDHLDQWSESRKVTFSMINRLWRRKALGEDVQNRGLLDVVIRQVYRFQNDSCPYGETPESDGFTDLEIEASSRPSEKNRYELVYVYDFDYDRTKLADFQYSASYFSHLILELGWRYSRIRGNGERAAEDADQRFHSIRGSLSFPFWNRWISEVDMYHDIENNVALEHRYRLTYRGSCWSGQFGYIHRFDDRQWNVLISLDSLGDLNF
ncbi:MAG: LPS-assembly protein LptD [bacterium]